MTFNIDRTTNTLSRAEFDRLFDEALYYMSEERQRLGDSLKEDIWGTFERVDAFIHRYEVDDYLVGAAALTELLIPWEGKVERWAWYLSPIYGETQAGSRSWWYSEEFSKQARQFCDEEGFDRLLAIVNPTSPAALAVKSTWDRNFDGRQYFETPLEKTMTETFGEHRDKVSNPDTMRCFILGKYNG